MLLQPVMASLPFQEVLKQIKKKTKQASKKRKKEQVQTRECAEHSTLSDSLYVVSCPAHDHTMFLNVASRKKHEKFDLVHRTPLALYWYVALFEWVWHKMLLSNSSHKSMCTHQTIFPHKRMRSGRHRQRILGIVATVRHP